MKTYIYFFVVDIAGRLKMKNTALSGKNEALELLQRSMKIRLQKLGTNDKNNTGAFWRLSVGRITE